MLSVTDDCCGIGNSRKALALTAPVGDLNGDRKVPMRNIAILARAFGSTPGSLCRNPIDTETAIAR